MGFIRGILLVFVSSLLFLSIFCATLFWTLSLSLNYDTLQTESVAVIMDFLQDNGLANHVKEIFPSIQKNCQNSSEYVFSYGENTYDVPCSIALQGEDAIIKETVKDSVRKVYYAEYNCNFLDCMKEMQIPMFLISEKAYIYWSKQTYLFLTISLVLSILLFFFAEKKTNVPIILGSFLIISSLPFIKLESLLALFSDKNPLLQFLKIFFSQVYSVSIRVLIAGIIFLVAGIILKIFKIGFFISNLISKIKKKPEVLKGKQKIKMQKKLFQKKTVRKKRYK